MLIMSYSPIPMHASLQFTGAVVVVVVVVDVVVVVLVVAAPSFCK